MAGNKNSGSKARPAKIHEIKGTFRGDRHNKHDIDEQIEAPTPPDYLSRKAKRAFNEIAKYLVDMQCITKLDKMALSLLCDAWCEWRDLREFVKKKGSTYETLTGEGNVVHKAYPQVAQASDAWRRIYTMMTDFGMTPSCRTKLEPPKKKEELDPLQELLNRKTSA